ncbi:sugar ABC transporter substrate-binding protein [Ureibacillus massiliensis 4400831 = CIP 108448 = CCUG 49529]|uniref:Sugar ABC transporter substrate-binding protein n=1 Tax=Ureibacillus massiliensis 4400831 = CIP 108448 = CCUG 49529 TaxID=1211035 RepID=A0A0A3J2G2_9BACL|nr:sugar ABC transporter substrate-binding protein [Ureibacillus massiliensis]KGR89353.1 sugar ABC transporter substrate-binding protein [Ureibacillus massiliensis 4400831 = CIP 108448 = CCUG 49529]
MKKRNWLLVLGLTLAMLLAACGSGEGTSTSNGNAGGSGSGSGDGDADGGTKNISVVLKTLSSPYWKYVEAGAKKAGEDLGVNVTIVGPSSEAEIIQQVNMLEDQLSQQPDAIVVSPTQPDTVIPVLEDASSQGVPVLLIDSDADFEGKVTFIGTENYDAGQEAGKEIASKLQPGDKVVLIAGALGNPATDARIKGAKDALEEAGMVIAAEQPADSDKAKAMSVMENILEAEDDIKAVFSANDDMAIGVLRAVEAANLDIIIYGTDGTEEAVQSIIDGGLTGTIAQNPYNMGYEGVKSALAAANGETVEERIDSGVEIITSENAQKQLEFLQSLSN